MNPQDLAGPLAQTLADHRLSGSERRALAEVLRTGHLDDAGLAQARHLAFDLARAELADPRARAVLDWLEEVVKLLLPRQADAAPALEACFSPGDECTRRIIGLLDSARQTVDVCVFTITDDRISQALTAAHRRGVRVRIITDNEKVADLGSDIAALEAAGLPVRVDRTPFHMHHKFAVLDGATVLTGSFNWTRSAAQNNLENFVVSGDARLVGPFTRTFERLWQELGR